MHDEIFVVITENHRRKKKSIPKISALVDKKNLSLPIEFTKSIQNTKLAARIKSFMEILATQISRRRTRYIPRIASTMIRNMRHTYNFGNFKARIEIWYVMTVNFDLDFKSK